MVSTSTGLNSNDWQASIGEAARAQVIDSQDPGGGELFGMFHSTARADKQLRLLKAAAAEAAHNAGAGPSELD